VVEGNGGGIYIDPFNANAVTVKLANTIVAGNTAPTGPDAFGTFASQGHNLIGKTDGSSGWVGSDLTGTIATPLKPLLAPLGYYGGPTQTMLPLPGSPALGGVPANTPGTPLTDQRGLPRNTAEPTDIGAVEIATPTVTPTDAGGAFNNGGTPDNPSNYVPYPVTQATVTGFGNTGVIDTLTSDPGNFQITYYSQGSLTPLPGAPSAVGSYTAVVMWTSNNPEYTNATGSVNFQISDPQITVASAAGPIKEYSGVSSGLIQLAFFTQGTHNNGVHPASWYTATVTWGDGTQNSSSDGSGTVIVTITSGNEILAEGSHTYTTTSGALNPIVTLSADKGANIASTGTTGNANAIAVDVAGSVASTQTNSNTYKLGIKGKPNTSIGTITITNTSGQALTSGISVVLYGINTNGGTPVTATSATITANGQSSGQVAVSTDSAGDVVLYISPAALQVLGGIGAGESFKLSVVFNNPHLRVLSYVAELFNDPFGP